MNIRFKQIKNSKQTNNTRGSSFKNENNLQNSCFQVMETRPFLTPLGTVLIEHFQRQSAD